MQTINCEHPVILINPVLKKNIHRYRQYYMRDKLFVLTKYMANLYRWSFPYQIFSVKRSGVTLQNMDSYYFCESDGTIVPMYIVVPCNKCPICRDKKSKSWSFRAVCENKYSTSQPLFLTLTYNPEHLPVCGIFKEEIQLFMKRLRRSLDRKNITHNIRYFACGEYGTKSGRPHYHLIFWNFPDVGTLYDKLHLIESAWRLPTGKYNSDGSPITSSIGFAYCVPCEHGAITYVMKYMRKQGKIPYGKNPLFFLSSRKNGGIGAQFARETMQFYRDNPHVTSMSVLDPYSNQIFESEMPLYYKTIIFPTDSRIISKNIRDTFEMLLTALSLRPTYQNLLDIYDHETMHATHKLSTEILSILRELKWLNPYIQLEPMSDIMVHLKKTPKSMIWNEYTAMETRIDQYVRDLSILTYDREYVKNRSKILAKRKYSLDFQHSNISAPDVTSNVLTLINRENLAISKEKL